MQVPNDSLVREIPDEIDRILRVRMRMLSLDLDAIGLSDSDTFEKIKRRCTICEFRKACALDLKRDPNSQVWEAYCANAPALNVLTALTEVLGCSPSR